MGLPEANSNLRQKFKGNKIQKFWILNSDLVSSLPQAASISHYSKPEKLFYALIVFSTNFHEYITKENLSNKIVWNYSNIMFCFHKFFEKILWMYKKEILFHKFFKKNLWIYKNGKVE